MEQDPGSDDRGDAEPSGPDAEPRPGRPDQGIRPPHEDPRAAARAAVSAAFAKAPPVAPRRTCPSCGAQATTQRAFCPECGKRYDRRLPWLSDRARWALGGASLVAAGVLLALILPGVFDARDEGEAAAAREHAARVAAERKRLAAEQRPRHGRAERVTVPAADAPAAAALAARAAMVTALERDIAADARSRVAAGKLDGPVLRVQCGPLVQGKTIRPDHEDLGKPRGRYDCVAVKTDVVRSGKVVGYFGHPFVGTIDFRRASYVWCKDNKAPGERGRALVKLPLARACLGAEGAARVGDGYAAPAD